MISETNAAPDEAPGNTKASAMVYLGTALVALLVIAATAAPVFIFRDHEFGAVVDAILTSLFSVCPIPLLVLSADPGAVSKRGWKTLWALSILSCFVVRSFSVYWNNRWPEEITTKVGLNGGASLLF